MHNNDFYGMMPILPTAVKPDGSIDEKSQRRLVRYALKSGAAAIGHFGIASEFHKISDAKRRQLTEIIIDETNGRVPVFIGVSAQSFDIALNYAREAHKLGADIIMAALPLLNLPTRDETYRFFNTLSSATPLPIIIQDIPQSSELLSAEFILKMFEEIENVKYIKAEGSNFLAKVDEIKRLSGDTLEIIGGSGGLHMIHLLRLGITSFMTGTEALELHNSVVQSFLRGDEERAAEIYFTKILPYFMFYDRYPEELLKAMLHKRGVIDHADIIPPRAKAPMSKVEWEEFNWILERVGLNKKWVDD